MRRIVSILTATVMAGLVTIFPVQSIPSSSASEYGVEDLTPYLMDFENASAPSDPRNYLSHNGVTYFTALSLQYGRAIWALDENTFALTMVADNWTGSITGGPGRLFARGDYLFFWDSNTSQNYSAKPYVLKISNGVVTELGHASSGAIASGNPSSFAALGDLVYFISPYSGQSPERLFTFDTQDGSVTDLGVTGFVHSNYAGTGTANDVNADVLSLFEHAGSLYTVIDLAHPNPNGLAIYNIAAGTWNTTISEDGWVELIGEHSFGGVDVALVRVATTVGTYSGSNYKLFSVATSGAMTQIGTGTDYDTLEVFQYGGKLPYGQVHRSQQSRPCQANQQLLHERSLCVVLSVHGRCVVLR